MDITKMTEEQYLDWSYQNSYARYERETKDNPKMPYKEWKKKEEEIDMTTEFPR